MSFSKAKIRFVLVSSLKDNLKRDVVKRVCLYVFTTGFVSAIIGCNRTGDFAGTALYFYGIVALEHRKINVSRLRLTGQVSFGFSGYGDVPIRARGPFNFYRHAIDPLSTGVLNLYENMVFTSIFTRRKLSHTF